MLAMSVDLAKIQQYDGRRFVTITVAGLGELKLASFSARRALEFRKLSKRQEAGQDVEFEMTRLLLAGSIVDDANKAIFDDAGAEAFMDRLAPEQLTALVTDITKLQRPEGEPEHPSVPSPSAA